MKPNTKRLLIILTAFCILLSAFSSIRFMMFKNVIKDSKTIRVEEYLCEKYNADVDDFELVTHCKGKYYLDTPMIFTYIEWRNDKWQYTYNGITFNVCYYDKHTKNPNIPQGFYDDYQIEEVFGWATEYLKENVDERINGISVNTYDLMEYQMQQIKNGIEVKDLAITQDKIFDFLNCSEANFHRIFVDADDSNAVIEYKEYDLGTVVENIDDIEEKLNSLFVNMTYRFDCFYGTEYYRSTEYPSFECDLWTSYYKHKQN